MRLLWAGICAWGALYIVGRELDWLVLPWPLPLVNRDFANLWMAARLVLSGDVASIFDPDAFRQITHQQLGITFANNYSYPPHALFLALPFGLLPYWLGLLAWNAFSLAAFYRAARPLIPESLPRWVAILNPAALLCLVFGHYGLICGALWLWSFRGHGLAAAALTIKPHLGLLVAVQMLRDRRALAAAVAGTAVLVGLSLLAFGTEPWRAFLHTTFGYQVGLLDGTRPGLNVSMVTPFVTYGAFGQIAFGAAAALLLWRRFDVFTAATASFLILPYGFHYDLTVVCLGFAVMLATRWDELSIYERVAGVLAFMMPALVTHGSWLAPPVLLAGLYVQTRTGTRKALGRKGEEEMRERRPQPVSQAPHLPTA